MSTINQYSTVRPQPTMQPEATDATSISSEVSGTYVGDLGAIIPTVRGRRIAYGVYAACAFFVGNIVVGLAAANLEQPVWVVIAAAVIMNSAPAFSALAYANTKGRPS